MRAIFQESKFDISRTREELDVFRRNSCAKDRLGRSLENVLALTLLEAKKKKT